MQEYGYLKCMLAEPASLGVQGLERGVVSACPCCWGAGLDIWVRASTPEEQAAQDELRTKLGGIRPLLGINIDFNFTLQHYLNCGSSSVRLAPPNQRYYMPALGSEESRALLFDGGAAAAATAAAARACSDFDAARVLARTSEKASFLETVCDVRALSALGEGSAGFDVAVCLPDAV